MKKILITGGTGLLGRSLVSLGDDYNIRAVYIGDYEIEGGKNVKYFKNNILDRNFEERVLNDFVPDYVIHTAGMANVDACEKDPVGAKESNVGGTKKMLELCEKFDSHMIYISTNAIYDGKNPPYNEESELNPINVYGNLKARCEEVVINSGVKNTIIRPIIMYGWNNSNERGNPVTWIIDQLKDGNEIKMVDDVYENPLFSESAAECIWKVVESDLIGIFNIAGGDVINRCEFAKQVAEVFDLPQDLISSVKSDYFDTLAPRPAETYFNTKKMEKVLKVKPLSFKDGLEIMKRKSE